MYVYVYIWALLLNCVERNSHKPESVWAEQNFPVPPSLLFRNDAAALPPRRFRSQRVPRGKIEENYRKNIGKNGKNKKNYDKK